MSLIDGAIDSPADLLCLSVFFQKPSAIGNYQEKTMEGPIEFGKIAGDLIELGTTMAETESEDLSFPDAFKFQIFDSNLFFLKRSITHVGQLSRQPDVNQFLIADSKNIFSRSKIGIDNFDWHFMGILNIFSEGRMESEVL